MTDTGEDLVPRENPAAPPELAARPALVAALVRDPAKVVVVSGPSGAGKSVLLKQGTAAVAGDRYVAGTYEVMWSDPLSAVLLDRLSEITSEVIADTPAIDRIVDRISGVMERMIETRGRELAHAFGRELVNIIRGRLGPEAGQAITEAVTALQEESAQSLAARLTRERAPLQREIIVDFFTEVAALAENRPILVILDRCERLDEAGARLLADLVETLPDHCQIWAGARDGEGPGDFLASRAQAAVVAVPPLDQNEIARMLEQRGLPPGSADEVIEETAGVALDVQASLALIEAEAPTSDNEAEAVVERDTARVMGRLEDDVRWLVLRLAVLSDPLPERYLTALAGGDEELLARAMRELDVHGFLTSHAEGEWIHERRAAAIRENADPKQAMSAVADAVAAVWSYVQQDDAHQRWLVELADLAGRAEGWELLEEDARVVLTLGAGELAVLAGFIELGDGGQPLVAEQLLKYVRITYPSDGDELGSLKRLGDTALVNLTTDGPTSVVQLTSGSLAQAIAFGRIAREFGQMPLPWIATAAFEDVLRPRLAPFLAGDFGVGFPSLKRLSFMALGRSEAAWVQPPASERRDAGPALIVRGRFADRPLYGAFQFSDGHQRDRALDAVTGLDIEYLDSNLEVTAAITYPMGVVPSNRFLRAIGQILGRSFGSQIGRAEVRLDEPLTFDEYATLRVEAHRVLRDLSGATMRGALGLDRPLSLHWAADETSALVVEVSGGREIASRHDSFSHEAWQDGAFQLFHLENELDLPPDETITNFHAHLFSDDEYSPVRHDPVLVEVDARRESAAGYNRAQPPLRLTLDESLFEPIRESFLREMADARTIAAALPLLGRDDWEVPPTTRHVVLTDEPYDPCFVAGANSTLTWYDRPSASGEDECHVAFEQDIDERADTVGSFSTSVQSRGIATLLGYNEYDIDLRHRDV